MPSVNSTKSGAFLTFLTDMMPCQMPRTVVLTLLYTAKRRIMYHARMQTAMPQTAVTAYPVAEKPDRMVSMLVPVRSKNVVKTWNWNTIVSRVDGSLRHNGAESLRKRHSVIASQHSAACKLAHARHDEADCVGEEYGVDARRRTRFFA